MLSLVSVILSVLLTAFQPLAVPSLVSTWPGGSVPSLTITPDLASRSAPAHSGIHSAFYDIYNGTTGAKTVSLACSGVAGCEVDPLQMTIGVGQHFDAQVTFTTGSANPSASLTLTATGQAVGSGTMALDIGPSMVQINAPGPDGSATQTVHRQRPVIRADFILGAGDVTDTTSIHLSWGGVDRTSELRRNTKFLEWEVGAADTLALGGSKSLVVTHCLTSGICTTESRTIQLPSDQKPVIDFTTMPLEMTGGGFSAGFGPGVGLSVVDVETGFATPAYVSMGAGRSAGLVYSTRTSYPRALVATTIRLPWPAGAPDTLRAVLYDGGVRMDSLRLGSPNCQTGVVHVCRVVLQADYASGMIAGGVDRRWMKVEVTVWSGATIQMTTDSVEVVLVDRRDSPYGTGWWPAGASRLYQDGADRILVGPSGTATIYRGSGDSVYVGPPGSAANLVKVSGGWELRPRGTTAKVVFDASGRLVKGVDASGNRDSIAYDITTGRVTKLVDPVGKTITFHYAGGVTGKLDSLVSLPGSSGARTTRVKIDTATNQLQYDSLSSPAARPIVARYSYQTYGAVKGTALLRSRYGRFGADSVQILYDSASSLRPIQARLLAATPNGTVPVIAYRAADMQGWKAFRSLDSIYVELTDPLNHWTRSRLNRWAEAEVTWDQLGTVGRSSYDNVGRVLSSEGKNGDSSRVYTDYDILGRVARTYIMRGDTTNLLRLDSLVYDASSRVIKRIDARGKADSLGYDAAGRPNYHRDAAGNISRSWYRSDGLVDSVRLPGASASRRTFYDATWKNPTEALDESGMSMSQDSLDPMGRTVRSQGKLRVKVTATTTQWQWRRSRSWLDAAGRVDSTARDQTLACNDPCTVPGSFVDSLSTRSRITRDSVGRTSQVAVIGKGTSTSSYLYDRLGRPIRVTHGSGARDSTGYDIRGNVVLSVTPRNDTIRTWFDSRNRDTLTIVPGYGSIHPRYTGPRDQLTGLSVTGYVDPIGGVNPNRAWVYDARGRLRTDTLWTGSVSRVSTYGYDTYERLNTTTTPLGTSTTRFETARGIADTLLSTFGDTVEVGYDGQGRIVGTNIVRGTGTPRVAMSRNFSVTGELAQTTTSVAPQGGGVMYTAGAISLVYPDDGKNMGVTLLPLYSKQDGSGAVLEVQEDSLGYDGFERLRSWRAMRNGALVGTENYTYDRNGNLTLDSVAVFDSASNRLLTRVAAGGVKSTYGYDAAGNLVQRTDSAGAVPQCTLWYGYDALDRLVSVQGRWSTGSTYLIARYAYDVTGDRIARRVYNSVQKCSNGTPSYTRYAVQGGHVQFESDSLGSGKLRSYLWGPGTDNLLAVRLDTLTDSTFYPITDKLGSIRAWVRRDGTWRWGARYRPYGATLDSTGTGLNVPYRWTGREYDPETGFYFLRARYYDPTMGRFIQEDPIGRAGGSNLYAYVDGQPLEARDPSGLRKDNGVYADYTWCSPQSGRCIGPSGSMMGNEYWWAPGGGGGGSASGWHDFDGDGRDDIVEFNWYYDAGRKFKENGGSPEEWIRVSMALDHAGYTPEAESQIRALFMAGKVKVVGAIPYRLDGPLKGLPDPTAAAQVWEGAIFLARGDDILYGGMKFASFFDWGLGSMAWVLAHEWGHLLGYSDEHEAGCFATRTMGWSGPFEKGTNARYCW